jgi:hypothetical protein
MTRRDNVSGPTLSDGAGLYTNAPGANQLPALPGDGAHVDLPTPIPLKDATTSDVLVVTSSIPLPNGVTGYAYCSAPGSVLVRFVNAAAAPGGNIPAGWTADVTFNVSAV